MKSHPQAGRINMRGRRSMRLSCRCCSVQDLRPAYAEELAAREMNDSLREDEE